MRHLGRLAWIGVPALALACASTSAHGRGRVPARTSDASPPPTAPPGAASGSAPAPGTGPDLAPPVAAPSPLAALSALGSPWGYVLPVDHGLRVDTLGKGLFRAPRSHGEHNGIDLLAPVGTPVLAPCAGQARAGRTAAGFGQWVHLVCPVPAVLGEGLYASFFYAHLETQAVGREYVPVASGARLGTVGKTGNAAAPQIAAHLHLELTLHGGEQAARDDTHSGRDQSNNPGAERFFRALRDRCLDPGGLAPKSGLVRRERRADPFLVLACLTERKPALTRPDGSLADASLAWSDAYDARGFDVDRGRGSARGPAHASVSAAVALRPAPLGR